MSENPHPIYYEPGGKKWRLTRPFYLGRRIPGFEGVTVVRSGDFNIEGGYLIGEIGSSWDGASAVAIDDAWNQPASYTHDKTYSAIALKIRIDGLERWEWERLRKAADVEFHRILIEMIPWIAANRGRVRKWITVKWLHVRARGYYLAVRWKGEDAMLGKYRALWKRVVDLCLPGACKGVRHKSPPTP